MSSKVYVNQESTNRFRPAAAGGGGTNLEVTSLASDQGYSSAQKTLASGARACEYEWRGKIVLSSPGTVGQNVQIFLATSDGTNVDGAVNTSGASITDKNLLRNLQYIGSLTVDQTGSNITLVSSGLCYIYSRYFQVVVWNGTDTSFSGTASDHVFTFTPSPFESQ